MANYQIIGHYNPSIELNGFVNVWCNAEYRATGDSALYTDIIVTQNSRALNIILDDLEDGEIKPQEIVFCCGLDDEETKGAEQRALHLSDGLPYVTWKNSRFNYVRYPNKFPGPWERLHWSCGMTAPLTGLIALEHIRMSKERSSTIYLNGWDLYKGEDWTNHLHSKDSARRHLRNIWLWDPRVVFCPELLEAIWKQGEGA